MESHHKFTSKLISQKSKFYQKLFSSQKIRKLNKIENSDINFKNKKKISHNRRFFTKILILYLANKSCSLSLELDSVLSSHLSAPFNTNIFSQFLSHLTYTHHHSNNHAHEI
jgi:hypothetical protein